MNVLLLGSGGREHALALALSKSPRLSRLFAAPGNPGIARFATLVSLNVEDQAAVAAFCKDQAIDLVVIGPEAPLVAGLVDFLAVQGIKAFGPTAAAAALEGSKAFAKEICAQFSIPTAASARFSDASSAKAYLRTKGAPIVVKADGLAAGKGVIVAETLEEAEAAIEAMFSGQFGEAGKTVLLEENSSAKKSLSSPCAMARMRWRSAGRRIIKDWPKAIRGRTRAAWARFRPCPAWIAQ